MARVLIIDDDEMIREMLADMAEDMGHEPTTAGSLTGGLRLASQGLFDVVFLDVYLPDGFGLDALPRIKDTESSPEVIVVTGSGEAEVAEKAMRNGAWDYVQKPLTLDSVTAPLERAVTYRSEKRVTRTAATLDRDGISGSSPLIRAVLETVALASESNASVLVSGETGTGKELVARAIHRNSPRAGGSFVVVDCASLPENLVEAILFGHVKGAFTGADKAREGLVTLADGGTLFLDEVGELPFSMQRSFLRVLEERTFRPVGAKEEIGSDFRLVAATNRNLDDMVRSGQFRKDLLFRIRSFHIEVPPLRERSDDVEGIVRLHMQRLRRRDNTPAKAFSPEFLDALTSYQWPGNVRELVQALEMGMAAAHSEPTLYLKHLPENIRVHYATTLVRRPVEGAEAAPAVVASGTPPDGRERRAVAREMLPGPDDFEPWGDYRERAVGAAERRYFTELLAAVRGSVKESCRIAGVSRARLYQILSKHGITRNR